MNDKYTTNFPFYAWVPRPLGILILLFMFVPPTFSGGAYLSNIGEMSGGLGLWTEDVQLASFFSSIGMCLFPPFMVRFLKARKVKQTYLVSFLLLIILNGICYCVESLPVLCAACLLTGFVRVIVMLNCTFTIAPYLTGMDTISMFTMKEEPSPEVQYVLERKRTFLMPVLYFFILMISQLSNFVTAWFAYHYHWQDAYTAVICMLLVAMILVFITMREEKKKFDYKIEWEKGTEMLLMAFFLCCMTFVLVYGKTMNWLDSDMVCIAFAAMLFSGAAILFLSCRKGEKSYFPLGVFGYRNVALSMLLFLLTMVFNSANNFVATFLKLSTSVNNLHVASLGIWAIVGCLSGLLISLIMIVYKVRFRTLFCVAFLLMAASNVYLYFQYQTVGLFQNMWLPVVLNFSGLLMLYSVVAAWGMKGLPSRYLATFVFLMIWMRNAIAPVVGASVYTNALNYKQQYYVTRLVQNVDSENDLASKNFSQTARKGRAMGKGYVEAEQLASMSLKGKVSVQATLVAMKDITGTTIVCLLLTSILVFFLPYRKNETT